MKAAFTIIGGGIAGLSAAIALKSAGIECIVLEAAPEFKPVGAGIVLAANALRAYQYIGVYESLKNRGFSISEVMIKDHNGRIITKTSTKKLKNSLDNIAIHRAELHEILLSFLSKDSIYTGKKVNHVEVENDHYYITFEDGNGLSTKYLIAADGIHSTIRKYLAPHASLRYSGYTCWRGIAQYDSSEIYETVETWGPKGRFGIVPTGNNSIYWFACKNAEPDSQMMKNYKKEDLIENFGHYHKPVADVLKNTPEQSIIHNDLYDLKPLSKFSYGNALLIGDAAHATTPNMGQGACMAIEDAVILIECLKKNSSVREAFLDFEKRRIKRTHEIVKQSWSIGRVAQTESKILGTIRNMLFRSIPEKIYQQQIEKIYNITFQP